MNQSRLWIAIFLFLAPSPSLADYHSKNGPQKVCDLAGNGGLPVPFSEFNRKVELAPGESYVLTGWIQFSRNGKTAFLKLDFSETPWLANEERKQFPYYPIVGWETKWNALRDKKVRIYAKASAQMMKLTQESGEDLYYYSIQLEPYGQPFELKDQRRKD